MFGNGPVQSEVENVAAPNEHEAVYEQLRERLVVFALGRGSSPHDAEDIAHDALEKLLRETVRPGAPKLEIRAFRAMKDKRAEYYRRQERHDQGVVPLMLRGEDGFEHERPEVAAPDAAIPLLETYETIAGIAGRDAMRFAILKACRATENDIAVLLGWTPQRTAAARIQLSRKKAEIAQAILDTLSEGGDTW
jgi:DNA-directed RNA polymerase specialized sigma24 family protein